MIKPPAMGEVECTKPIGRTEEVKPADTGTVIDRHVVVYELVSKSPSLFLLKMLILPVPGR